MVSTADGSGSAERAPDEWNLPGLDPSAPIERLALKLLATREHSRRELARKLGARGFDPALVDGVMDRLIRAGALDESRLAEHYVAERSGKGFGPLRIRAELWEKGLAEDLFDPYLDALEADWPDYLAAAYERRFGPGQPVDRADYARRARFLEQRGFPPEMIRRYLRWND
jgi:regulatory protein